MKGFLTCSLQPEGVKLVGYRWNFVQKQNENGEIVRYKTWLVAQGFSQRPSIDFEETYSLVLDATKFRYLISLVAQEGLNLHLMDVVTVYLYSSFENDIYMKLPEEFNLPNKANSKEGYSIKFNKSLYGLKK